MVLLPGMDGKLTISTLCPEAEETPQDNLHPLHWEKQSGKR